VVGGGGGHTFTNKKEASLLKLNTAACSKP